MRVLNALGDEGIFINLQSVEKATRSSSDIHTLYELLMGAMLTNVTYKGLFRLTTGFVQKRQPLLVLVNKSTITEG